MRLVKTYTDIYEWIGITLGRSWVKGLNLVSNESARTYDVSV